MAKQHHLLLILFRGCLHLLDIFLLKSMQRHRVQTEKRLVGVLDQYILALVHAKDHVDNGTHNTPTVVQVERHLRGKFPRLVSKDTENDMVVVVLGIGTRHEARKMLAACMYINM